MTKKCQIGDWVEIHLTILEASMRSKEVLPEDTQNVPLEAWIKGYALTEAKEGEKVLVRTRSGRQVEGILTAINPGYEHTYGPAVRELIPIGDELRAMLKGGGSGG